MSELSRQSSRVAALSDDATSLTSFPDPGSPTLTNTTTEEANTGQQPTGPVLRSQDEDLDDLLGVAVPSMFDDETTIPSEPQALSAAPSDILKSIIDHRGALDLTRRLATLLAQRDAHITALTRLAEEYKIPRERINDAASRADQSEQRRLALATAANELMPLKPSTSIAASDSSGSVVPLNLVDVGGTSRNLTKLFGGGTTRLKATPDSSRSASRAPSSKLRMNKPQSIDARSVHSQENSGLTNWASNLLGTASKPRRDSQSQPQKGPVEMVTQHDKDQLPPTLSAPTKDPHEALWNRFILRLNESRSQSGEHLEGGETIGMSRFGQEGSLGQQKLKALTQLVLGGIPISIRHAIWMELSNTHAMMTPGGYKYHLSQSQHGDPMEIEDIMKDVPRTLTRQSSFYVGKGYDRLKTVLVAFVNRYEGLGYTQGLNTIAGYLLLTIPTEDDAFWVLCNIIENFFPAEYFSRSANMNGPLADNVVLRQCIREQLPQLAKHLDDLGVRADNTVPLSWFFTAFATALPQELLMRIWDVWLCLPGQRTFIFNIALTILAQNSGELLECESEGEYWSMLEKCTAEISQDTGKINELIKQAFAMRKRLEHVEDRRRVEFKVLRRKRDSTEALYDETSPGGSVNHGHDRQRQGSNSNNIGIQ